MNHERRQLLHSGEGSEHNKPDDRLSERATIVNKVDNKENEAMKLRDALRSFKLTADGQNSFTIFDETTEYKDNRPLRQEQATTKLADLNSGSSASATEETARDLTDKLNEAFGMPTGLREAQRKPDHDFRSKKEQTMNPAETTAPPDVVVITAHGLPGRVMTEASWDPSVVIPNDRLAAEIKMQQVEKGQRPPQLVWLKACHSGEASSNPPSPSVASEMAKKTGNYVLGVDGAQSPPNTDQTHPVNKVGPAEVPNPAVSTKVILYGPDGQECARFDTPVDFKEVQKWMKEHPQKNQSQKTN